LASFGSTDPRSATKDGPMSASQRVPMTPRGHAMLQEEFKRLKNIDRPQIVKEIEEARSHGDISENAEYHAAKERQGLLEGRIRILEDKLARAQIIDGTGQGTDRVSFGATVVLENTDSGEQVTYTIVGEDEADLKSGLISVTSPVARALMGKEQGVEVQVRAPKGIREFEILEIRLDLE
jgi:transcription elongation factor GreA